MKNLILLFAFSFILSAAYAQEEVNDEAVRYQQQRMVFQQWNQGDFKPGKGFLDTNPYYWLVWGLFDPNYHKTDLRPLSPTGPQTQRLALVGAMNSTDSKYKLHSDTVRNTALSEIANQSGLLSDADPLWLLYYKQQLNPVINDSMVSIMAGLSPQVSAKLVSEGLYGWYKNELDMLKERIQGARTTNMDRGSRIMSYYRFLNEYRRLSGVWAIRTSSAQMTLNMTSQQLQLQTGKTTVPDWTPNSDVQIANKVLQNAQY
ncbi:hypothetical protein HDF18_13240 [Mucilaginibacter sp. X5P1]|uniref:hypothetical protein n=1 Tax=Mucilaginibacter sp. X5P1 TaxID=2723088 RepID=UPI0016147502|nr:hypothetical protein [Mucilaginibacter sp. X5P1]MBB6141694.1 hypothetical protein [Mucilaginibacter sp. X5P1]